MPFKQKRYHLLNHPLTYIPAVNIMTTFLTVVRPVLEHACQIWHTGLTTEQHDNTLEKIQEQGQRISDSKPPYNQALTKYKHPTLRERRDTRDLCKKLFSDMKKEDHRLHALLPKRREKVYSTIGAYDYPWPKVRTER